ncbi:MAG TPA: hypothetical protein VF341_03470 [Anaeromyxobacteraceae bacterium]
MPNNLAASIDQIIREAVAPVLARASEAIARAVAEQVAEQLGSSRAPRRKGKVRAARARSRRELTRWVADKRARRVPTFVIEMTGGLDTKKRIVAKFGVDAAFEKGKPLPKTAKAA